MILRSLLSALCLCVMASLDALAAEYGAPKISGSWIQGAPVFGQVLPGSSLQFEGRKVPLTEDGRFVIGLAFDAAAAAELIVTSPDGSEHRQEYAVAQREYEEQRISGLPQKMVTPPDSVSQRIANDQALVVKARGFDTPRDDAFDKWRWPVSARVTGVFGAKRILNGVPRQPHFGIDLAAGQGTAIHAPVGGIVRMAHKDLYYTGGTIILDHGRGITTTYLHLSKLDVAIGDVVSAGQRIGKVGSTGRATGPHLCWRANWFDVRLDPSLMLQEIPVKKGEIKK